jgi:small subunit ribosomal protein S4
MTENKTSSQQKKTSGIAKCKICRRAGAKLFLRGERCLSQKCSIIKKPYPPGQKAKKRMKALSEYGKELKEKQKLKNWYNLEEKQFRNYVKEILKTKSRALDARTRLIIALESRLDNVIFRLGFAPSRRAARQMVSHCHFTVNGKSVNIASYSVKKGDKINVVQNSLKKNIFQKLPSLLKKYNPPLWLQLKAENLEGKVVSSPNLEEAAPPAELSSIFEFYSK